MIIDCDTCAVRNVHCHDCVVSAFLDLPRARPPLEFDAGERDALGSLVAAGLVPPLRLVALSAPEDADRGIA